MAKRRDIRDPEAVATPLRRARVTLGYLLRLAKPLQNEPPVDADELEATLAAMGASQLRRLAEQLEHEQGTMAGGTTAARYALDEADALVRGSRKSL
jgi:hypothetical protein